MRLYLLPISTRRTLLYCQKLDSQASENKTLVDKATTKAATIWASWEKKDKGWQKSIVNYGNQLFRRIPYEEWGLKSVPPLSTRRRENELQGKDKVQLVYPEIAIPTTKAMGVLSTLATERDGLHRKKLVWCLIGMPITAPFALVPVIPNLPFFYLAYRAWSHWRALAGGKHILFLSSNSLLSLAPSPTLDAVYRRLLPAATGSKLSDQEEKSKSATPIGSEGEEEKLLLSQEDGQELVKTLDIPELEVEIERAIWQVENSIEKKRKEKGAKTATLEPPVENKDVNEK